VRRARSLGNPSTFLRCFHHVFTDCPSRGGQVHNVHAVRRQGRSTTLQHQRRSRGELHDILLQEGREILNDEGIETGSSNLTFKRVFDRVEAKTGDRITNASVIRRIWDNQADFQTDVLVSIAQDEARPEAGGALDAIGSILGALDLTSPESRAIAVREICRVGGTASSAAIDQSVNWPLWINVVAMATATASPVQQQRIKKGLAKGYESVADLWKKNFEALVALLGLRLRPRCTLDQFVLAVVAFSEGCSLRQRVSDHIEVLIRPTGPNGEDQEWSLFAFGLEALVHQFLEPDPDFEPPG